MCDSFTSEWIRLQLGVVCMGIPVSIGSTDNAGSSSTGQHYIGSSLNTRRRVVCKLNYAHGSGYIYVHIV